MQVPATVPLPSQYVRFRSTTEYPLAPAFVSRDGYLTSSHPSSSEITMSVSDAVATQGNSREALDSQRHTDRSHFRELPRSLPNWGSHSRPTAGLQLEFSTHCSGRPRVFSRCRLNGLPSGFSRISLRRKRQAYWWCRSTQMAQSWSQHWRKELGGTGRTA
jgi:hypothetical protein